MIKSNPRLNLGSGTDYVEGWTNVDISDSSKVDINADLTKKFPFEDNSASEIKASDILEHFTKLDGENFLRECHRVLKNDGKILIRTHNVSQIYNKFSQDPRVLIHFLYGDQKEGIPGVHKYAYTKDSITILLNKIGFRVENIREIETNLEVSAFKELKIEKKITVGVIMQSPDMGGAENFMLNLVKGLRKKEDSVIIATNKSKFKEEANASGIKTFEIPFVLDMIGNLRGIVKTFLLLPYAIFFYIKLLLRFKREKVDIILMSNFTEKLLITFISVFMNIPVVWIEYGSLHAVFKKNLLIPKIIYRFAKNIPRKIIVPSQNTLESMIKDARVSLSKVEIIQLGVEIPDIKPKTHSNFVIGNVSRLTEEKGQSYLIKAMPQLLKKIPNAELILIGDGPSKESYKNLTDRLDLKKNVIFLGFVEDVQSYYDEMDVFVFPTIWDMEGFGLVVVEAMMHKLPVIASDIGPVPEIIIDDDTGFLVNPKDEEDLVNKITHLYRNPGKMKRMGERGYERALYKFSMKRAIDDFRNILYEAVYS